MRFLTVADIPFIDLARLDGRIITSLHFHHEGDWHLYISTEEPGSLIKVKGVPAEGVYFAAAPAHEDDLYLHVIDFLAQCASHKDLMKARSGLIDDVLNLSTSLDKIAGLRLLQSHYPHALSRMMVTEVEYITIVCRSLFDLLQEIVRKLWPTIRFHDERFGRRPLRKSFAEMLEFGDAVHGAPEIAARHAIPLDLASCYARASAPFLGIRRLRDNIVHWGSRVGHIYASEDFLIPDDFHILSDLVRWRDEERGPNRLVPLLPALEMLIYQTLRTCDHFSRTLENIIQFPGPIAPGMNQFLRGYSTGTLNRAMRSAEARLLDQEPAPHPPPPA